MVTVNQNTSKAFLEKIARTREAAIEILNLNTPTFSMHALEKAAQVFNRYVLNELTITRADEDQKIVERLEDLGVMVIRRQEMINDHHDIQYDLWHDVLGIEASGRTLYEAWINLTGKFIVNALQAMKQDDQQESA